MLWLITKHGDFNSIEQRSISQIFQSNRSVLGWDTTEKSRDFFAVVREEFLASPLWFTLLLEVDLLRNR
jgi:hypothetical protein